LKEKFDEMAPLFCNMDVPFDKIGDHMQEYVRDSGMDQQEKRRLLVGGMKARRLLIASPLLKWYLDHDLVVTRVHQIIEFTPNACFKPFTQDISDARRQGDVDKSNAIIADTMKLLGNSAYGSMILDKTRHQSVKYVEGVHQAQLKANDPKFRKMSELDDDYYEIELAKKSICLDIPVQIGFFILQLAKMKMLQFYYDVIDKYVDRSDFQLCAMDTDSNYFAFTADSLDAVIKPDMREAFYREMDKWFPSQCCSNHKEDFVQCKMDGEEWYAPNCCKDRVNYDKRTPGLFKEEFQGDVIISLCSKTYCVENWSEDKAKFSCKGVSKRGYVNPIDIYRQVLYSKQCASGLNRGFRARNNTIYTYEQTKTGFSYFYCKRKILEDGCSTTSLDLELCPWEEEEEGQHVGGE
jgi:hypothetical protein